MASDCPTGVDMATYKAEALRQKRDVEGLRRPRSHVLLGRLPRWADRAAPVAGSPTRMLGSGRSPDGARHRRHRPAPVHPVVRQEDAAQVGRRRSSETPDVWIWADSFSDHFFPVNGHAAIRYLASVGLTARVIPDDACCGLTWITTGQLDEARAIMERTVAALKPYVESQVPVIALEPSCLATLRSDAAELDRREPRTS